MTILKAENISKQYRLGTVGTGTLGDDLKRLWYTIRGKEDPFLKVGAVNDRSSNATEDYVWALRDIEFEVEQGEVLGIIGKNGAGKSTLLKILSQVTTPTTGSIKTRGRIASLLEVGTGFNGELTGRENIFMNGAVLGMTRKEIRNKLDEIIAFSGCEKYIDTPVKRYSSGMTVRLGFAVAAHLEPEILVVDEVLAVGDAEFQKKAIGKMQDLSKGEGRTVLFVSHNMAAVENLCNRLLLLINGGISFQGDVKEGLNLYLRKKHFQGVNKDCRIEGSQNIKINKVNFINPNGNNGAITGEELFLEFSFFIETHLKLNTLRLDFKIENLRGNRIAWLSSEIDPNFNYSESLLSNKIVFYFKSFPLIEGKYMLSYVLKANNEVQEDAQDYMIFEVVRGNYYKSGIEITPSHTPVLLDYKVFSNSEGH